MVRIVENIELVYRYSFHMNKHLKRGLKQSQKSLLTIIAKFIQENWNRTKKQLGSSVGFKIGVNCYVPIQISYIHALYSLLDLQSQNAEGGNYLVFIQTDYGAHITHFGPFGLQTDKELKQESKQKQEKILNREKLEKQKKQNERIRLNNKKIFRNANEHFPGLEQYQKILRKGVDILKR